MASCRPWSNSSLPSDHHDPHRLDTQKLCRSILHYSENGPWIYPQVFLGSAIQEKELVVTLLPWSWSIKWIRCQTTPKVSKKWPKLFVSIRMKSTSISIALDISESLSSADLTLVKRRSCRASATLRSAPTFIIPGVKRSSPSLYCVTHHWWAMVFVAWSQNCAWVTRGELQAWLVTWTL